MSNTKLRIDLSQGIIEAEGSEEFVSSIYSDFKDNLKTIPSGRGKRQAASSSVPTSKKNHSVNKITVHKKAKSNPPKSKTTPTVLKNLDLGGGSNLSLKEFFNKYIPKNNMERNLVFAYYLQHIVEEEPITLEHIFTCYRHMKLKSSKAIHQSLVDTSRIHGWLDTSSMNDIKVPISGMNHIEHEMKKRD